MCLQLLSGISYTRKLMCSTWRECTLTIVLFCYLSSGRHPFIFPSRFASNQRGCLIPLSHIWFEMSGLMPQISNRLLINSAPKRRFGTRITLAISSLRKKILRARLRGIQVALASGPNDFLIDLEKRLIDEYANLSKIEEEFWAMKLKVN